VYQQMVRISVATVLHVVEMFYHVFVENVGECFGLVDFWNVYMNDNECMFVFAIVRFSKCKSLYLNEREKCYARQIYAFNPHKM